MKPLGLRISLIGLLIFGQQAMAFIEMARTGQYFIVASTANGFNNNGELVIDQNQSAFGTILYGEQGRAVSSSCPGGHASADISVWGGRTNLSGDTYEFEGFLGGDASLAQEGTYGGSSVDYRQIYDFSVNTKTGGTETVTIDVSQLSPLTVSPGVNFSGLQASLSRDGMGYDFDIFYKPGISVFELPDGDYRLALFVCSANPASYGSAAFAVSWKHTVRFSNLKPVPGWQHNLPITKDSVSCRYCYDFHDIPRATWVGATAATEFSFQMIGNSLFTGIMGFPPGFTNQFEVIAGGTPLGLFTTNQPVDFVGLVGHAIPSFKVRNICPIEGGSSNLFSIMLNFDTSTADFVMIPNPGLTVVSGTNGNARVFFAGALEQSTNLVDWTDVPQSPASPYLVTPATSPVPIFFRSRRP